MIETPKEPDFVVCWDDLDTSYQWVRDMRGCPQDPVFHAEGDVWIHTRMVCEALAGCSAWRSNPCRDIVFKAAVLHDVAKPRTTRRDGERVRSPGHSRVGACMARRILWEMGASLKDREQICSMISHHQDPFWTMTKEEPQRLIARISQTTDLSLLCLLSEADIRGRLCVDQDDVLLNIQLFETMAEEMGCFQRPWLFANGKSRFECFKKHDRNIFYEAHEDEEFSVVMMSGLPGTGKDTWIRKELDMPMVSLDDIRKEHNLPSDGNQSAVVRIAKEQCKELLRKKQSFVYNATNLTGKIRREWIDLFTDYHARIRIVYLETSPEQQQSRNVSRDMVVPAYAVEAMLDDWEVPTVLEAHQVEHLVV